VQRQAHVIDRARERGKVVDVVDRPIDVDVLNDVVVDELELRAARDVGEILERTGLEVVDAHHPVALGE
jgi:hypothetical protein